MPLVSFGDRDDETLLFSTLFTFYCLDEISLKFWPFIKQFVNVFVPSWFFGLLDFTLENLFSVLVSLLLSLRDFPAVWGLFAFGFCWSFMFETPWGSTCGFSSRKLFTNNYFWASNWGEPYSFYSSSDTPLDHCWLLWRGGSNLTSELLLFTVSGFLFLSATFIP